MDQMSFLFYAIIMAVQSRQHVQCVFCFRVMFNRIEFCCWLLKATMMFQNMGESSTKTTEDNWFSFANLLLQWTEICLICRVSDSNGLVQGPEALASPRREAFWAEDHSNVFRVKRTGLQMIRLLTCCGVCALNLLTNLLLGSPKQNQMEFKWFQKGFWNLKPLVFLVSVPGVHATCTLQAAEKGQRKVGRGGFGRSFKGS